MTFLAKFKKDISKIEGVNLDIVNPMFWTDFGNYIINKVLSGKYNKGGAQGRISGLAGPSGAGKSYLASNVAKYALAAGYGVLYIDTENAIDTSYLEAIGMDPEDPNFVYVDCIRISQCISIVNSFIKNYKEGKESQPYIIIIDSLDMLLTDGDAEKYDDKGEIGGDQGQWAKQCKKMLQVFTQDIKRVNVHLLCTKQVYINQDPVGKYQEPFKFTDCLKFAFSQIAVVSKLLLKREDSEKKKSDKDSTDNKFKGINLQVYGFKTRFTKPFQKCSIEVPYDEGMDRYSGTLEAAVSLKIIEKNGGWYTFKGNKFQKSGWKNDDKLKAEILAELIAREDESLDVDDEEFELDLTEAVGSPKEMAAKRLQKLAKLEEANEQHPEE